MKYERCQWVMVMMVQRLMKYEMTMDDGDDGTTINEI
jgi:hypothetical protein